MSPAKKELATAEEKIDLTNLGSASPFLQKEIFANGELLFGDEYEFTELKTTALRQYIATKSLRDLRSKMIVRRQKMLAEKIYVNVKGISKSRLCLLFWLGRSLAKIEKLTIFDWVIQLFYETRKTKNKKDIFTGLCRCNS